MSLIVQEKYVYMLYPCCPSRVQVIILPLLKINFFSIQSGLH